MTRKLLSLIGILSLGMLLPGCGSSPPNKYYLLAAQDFPEAAAITPSVGVGPIQVPEYLNRQQMVYKQEAHTLQVANLDMWAEPLENGVQRVLLLNLSGLLETQNVRLFPWHPKRAPHYGVKVSLLRLDADENKASMTADWLLYLPGTAETVQRNIGQFELSLSTNSPEAEEVAAAYSALLMQLSEVIATAIQQDQTAQVSATAP